MTHRVAAVVVTYNPAPGIVRNISVVSTQVSRVVIVDNGSAVEAEPYLHELEADHRCTIIRNGQNLGIAAALNLGLKYALEVGCDWTCTLDQDSTVCDGFISEMLRTFQHAPYPERVALITPSYVDRESGSMVRLRRSATGEILATMTSGSMVPSLAIQKLGLFQEDLFIDGVDTEFCLRARRAGLLIIQSPAVLLHSLGRTTYHCLFGLRFGTTNHSAARHYYISRNRFKLLSRYWVDWRWSWREIKGMVFDFTKIALVERNKWSKFRAMGAGTVDALRGRVGKRIEL